MTVPGWEKEAPTLALCTQGREKQDMQQGVRRVAKVLNALQAPFTCRKLIHSRSVACKRFPMLYLCLAGCQPVSVVGSESEPPYPFISFRTGKELMTYYPGQEITRWPPQLQLCTFTSSHPLYTCSLTAALRFGTAVHGQVHSVTAKPTFPYTKINFFQFQNNLIPVINWIQNHLFLTHREKKEILCISFIPFISKRQAGEFHS